MLSVMKSILTKDNQNKVSIPVCTIKDDDDDDDDAAPRLYKIDYSIMYEDDEEGMKYIHDPFPALIKSAVNWSAFIVNSKEESKQTIGFDDGDDGTEDQLLCKLLPTADKASEPSSFDILDILDRAELRALEKK
jgi:hypothetical protein